MAQPQMGTGATTAQANAAPAPATERVNGFTVLKELLWQAECRVAAPTSRTAVATRLQEDVY